MVKEGEVAKDLPHQTMTRTRMPQCRNERGSVAVAVMVVQSTQMVPPQTAVPKTR